MRQSLKITMYAVISLFTIVGMIHANAAETNLSFTPVTPCRIVDTRVGGGGAFSPGQIREYYVYGSSAEMTPQGGNSAGCISPGGEPTGVHINITAVPLSGTGNFVVFPADVSPPENSLIIYKTGVQNIANGASIQTLNNSGAGVRDIKIKNNSGSAHVVIDVTGYYYPNSVSPRTITATAGANGSISPAGAVAVDDGSDQTFTITPDANYYVSDVLVDGVSVGPAATYTFTNVTANHTIAASFATGPRTITATAGSNGSISPTGAVVVSPNSDQTFTITPDGNYYVSDVLVDGVSVGAVATYTFTNVTAYHTIAASFGTNIITATAGPNGSISPSGAVAVGTGATRSFTITADTNYHVSDVLVDGVSIGAETTYTFINVTSDHTIEASFEIDHIFVAIGDSITVGTGDDDPSDDTSQDGRNTGGGYEPVLNDLLTAFENGIPHNIINAGVGGTTSADGLASIATTLAQYPEAQRYLVMYGTNDARPWLPVPSGLGLHPGDPGYPGTYKDNMQQIINAINNAGKEACLAKPPIALGDSTGTLPYPDPDTGARSVLIKKYNQVIDEFVSDPLNNITVTPPDFYNYFKGVDPATGNPRYEDQYYDNIHPNGLGYRSMADRWFIALTP